VVSPSAGAASSESLVLASSFVDVLASYSSSIRQLLLQYRRVPMRTHEYGHPKIVPVSNAEYQRVPMSTGYPPLRRIPEAVFTEVVQIFLDRRRQNADRFQQARLCVLATRLWLQ